MSVSCYYINLDSAAERRLFLEGNFYDHNKFSWPLNRIEATTIFDVELRQVQGGLTPQEKACFDSHVRALEASLNNQHHALILEDDALFGPNSFGMIERALENLVNVQWDVLYLDLGLTNPAKMVEFFMLRKEMARGNDKGWNLIQLDRIAFVGATAYIVNRNSKLRLYEFFKSLNSFDVPFDLALRNMVWTKAIQAYVIYPFATTLSVFADKSQIQLKQTEVIELVWNAFRRLVWFDAEGSSFPNFEQIKKEVADQRSNAMADVVALSLADKFGIK